MAKTLTLITRNSDSIVNYLLIIAKGTTKGMDLVTLHTYNLARTCMDQSLSRGRIKPSEK